MDYLGTECAIVLHTALMMPWGFEETVLVCLTGLLEKGQTGIE